MKLLEENKDVSPETVQIFKQMQQMQQGAVEEPKDAK
jgi:hypothetical protein